VPAAGGTAASGGPSSQAAVPVERNPPGDIPDTVAYVPYTNPAGRYTFSHPEGWAQAGAGTRVTFTDKLNGIAADVSQAGAAPTVSSVAAAEVPTLRASQPAFELRSVSAVTLPAGPAVRIVYRRNSAADPVTGRQIRQEVEEYLVEKGGREIRLELSGPAGADNVDPYRTITQSLRLS
jgi:hypothetical protein